MTYPRSDECGVKYRVIWQCKSCSDDVQVTLKTLDIDKITQKGMVIWKVMDPDPTGMTEKKDGHIKRTKLR